MMIDILGVVGNTLNTDQETWKEVLLVVVDAVRTMQEDPVEDVREKARSVMEEWNEQM